MENLQYLFAYSYEIFIIEIAILKDPWRTADPTPTQYGTTWKLRCVAQSSVHHYFHIENTACFYWPNNVL